MHAPDDTKNGVLPEMCEQYITSMIPTFRWFAHVSFGNGILARSTEWPDADLESPHMGVSKFEYIVRRNLPDLQGKRVLDLGCNAGLVAIHMVRLGAAEVVGVDTDTAWPRWKEQAEFVRAALEWRCRTKYNVRYVESDIRDLPSLDLGGFDIVTALNSMYYLAEGDIARVTRHLSTLTDVFLIQCNTRDQSHLGARPTPRFMERMLRDNGFPHVHVDAPWDHPRRFVLPRRYCRPVVVGRKTSEGRERVARNLRSSTATRVENGRLVHVKSSDLNVAREADVLRREAGMGRLGIAGAVPFVSYDPGGNVLVTEHISRAITCSTSCGTRRRD